MGVLHQTYFCALPFMMDALSEGTSAPLALIFVLFGTCNLLLVLGIGLLLSHP